MVKHKYFKPLLATLLVAIALYVWLRPSAAPLSPVATAVPSAAARTNPAARPEQVPAIGLDRASAPREATAAGRRNVFAFYQPPPPPPPVIRNPQALLPPVPTPTPVPPLTIQYVGTAERSGARRAIFLTDNNEVLTGGEGETIANRVKVVRINLESIDVQDLWSGQPSRLPLKGNR